MIDPISQICESKSSNFSDFQLAFLSHIHELLFLGYQKLDAKALSTSDEPSITGELVRGIRAVMDDPDSADWVVQFNVEDDPPVNDGKSVGKRRPRVDIGFSSNERKPRDHLVFEAKRLGPSHPIAGYLNRDGLGCFLAGQYAAKDGDAGMLGYVQSSPLEDWADKLGKKLKGSSKKYAVCSGYGWKKHSFKGGPGHTFHTRHRRDDGRQIEIYHSLLRFC